jgi:hypothetical protein
MREQTLCFITTRELDDAAPKDRAALIERLPVLNRKLPRPINQMFFINLLDEKLSPRSKPENYILRNWKLQF